MITKEDFKYVEFERDVDLSQPLMVRSDKRNRINAIDIAFIYETAAELNYLSHEDKSAPSKLKLGALNAGDLRAAIILLCDAFRDGLFYSSNVYKEFVNHKINGDSFLAEIKNYQYSSALDTRANVLIPEGRDASPLNANRTLTLANAIYDFQRRIISDVFVKNMFAVWDMHGSNPDSYNFNCEEIYPIKGVILNPNRYVNAHNYIYVHEWRYSRGFEEIPQKTGYSIGGDGEFYYYPYVESKYYERAKDLYTYFKNTNFSLKTFVEIEASRNHSSNVPDPTEGFSHEFFFLEGEPRSSKSIATDYLNTIEALGGPKDDLRQPLIDSAAVASANNNGEWWEGSYQYSLYCSPTYYIFNPLVRIVKMFEL